MEKSKVNNYEPPKMDGYALENLVPLCVSKNFKNEEMSEFEIQFD